MMSRPVRCGVAALLASAAVLGGCDPGAPGDAPAAAISLETFCAAPGLAPALRHTTLVVDTGALQASAPEEFRARNPEFFKLAIGLADPAGALLSGAIAPRERITILAASPRSATLTPVFTGCVPGASPAEIAAGAGSAAQKYFGSDLASQVEKQQAAFTRQLLLSLMALNKLSETPAPASERFQTSPLVKLLKPLGSQGADDPTVRRLFIFTDLRRSVPTPAASVAAARTAGFETAAQAQVTLGLAETYIVTPGGPPVEEAVEFLKAFMLGSQADLRRVGGFSANGMTPAPTTVAAFRGSLAATPDYQMPMTLRLAATADGQIVNSWISYTGSRGVRATPLAGEWTCRAANECRLRSDPSGGLGQLWRLRPGPEPEVREDAPLGGLRFAEATETPSGLKGRIWDPVISIGRPGGGMSFEAQRAGT